MKKSYLLVSLAVMLVLSLSMMSCKNSKKHRDYDEDKYEKIDDDKDRDRDITSDDVESDAVSHFCETADEIAKEIASATSESDIDYCMGKFDTLTSSDLDDTTPLSYTDKQALGYSLGYLYGVVIGRMAVIDGDDVDEDALTEIVEAFGVKIDEAVKATNNMSELEENLDRYVNSAF